MFYLVNLVDVILVVFTTAMLVRRIRFSMRTRYIFAADLVYGILYIAHIVPMALSRIVTDWEYSWICNPMLIRLARTPQELLIHRTILGLTFLMLLVFGRSRKIQQHALASNANMFTRSTQLLKLQPSASVESIQGLCWLLLLIPFAAVLFSPEPLRYLSKWATPAARGFSFESIQYYTMVTSTLCSLALLAYAIIIWIELKKHRTVMYYSIMLSTFIAIAVSYVQGKRSMLLFVLIVFSLYSFKESRIRMQYLAYLWIVFILFMLAYLTFGKAQAGADLTTRRAVSEFFRDYTMRPALVGASWTQHSAMPRGSGLIFQSAFFVPRRIWAGKPWPTPVYMTSWIMGARDRFGWGFGMGFMEDGLANFGYLGWFLYTTVVLGICRFIDRMVYRKETIYLLLGLFIVYASAFAFSVLIKLAVFTFIPLLILGPLVANPRNWLAPYRPLPRSTPT